VIRALPTRDSDVIEPLSCEATEVHMGGIRLTVSGKTTAVHQGVAEVVLEMEVPSDPGATYTMFVQDIERWWSRDYVMGGERTTGLVLEDVPGGRLLEKWGSDGAVWAHVTQVARGRTILLGIPEGAIWSGPGYVRLTFDPTEGGGTKLTLHHASTQVYAEDAHAGYVTGWTVLVLERFGRFAAGEKLENALA
jgi:hypothetical protein